jgi:hypothetical protein
VQPRNIADTWFAGIFFAAGAYLVYLGFKMAVLRRPVENPMFEIRGRKLLLLGLALLAVGALAMGLAVGEIRKIR